MYYEAKIKLGFLGGKPMGTMLAKGIEVHHYRRDDTSPLIEMNRRADAIYAEARELHDTEGGDATERMAELWCEYSELLTKIKRMARLVLGTAL